MTWRDEDPAAFLEGQGWPYRREGSQLVTDCPLCGKGRHLYIHQDRGVWNCKRCGESGNLYQLRQRLGLGNGRPDGIASLGQALRKPPSKRIPLSRVEAMHAALLADRETFDYCTKTRCWAPDVVKAVKVGLRSDSRGKWLAFPWWRRGEVVGIKYRSLPPQPKAFDREPDCPSILFNRDIVDGNEEVILASGEPDALALLSLGFRNVTATTTGEGALPPADVDALAKKRRVLVPFDNDAAGQQGARNVGRRIGFDRVWLVPLPAVAHDVNDFLILGGTREEFEGLLVNAVQFDVPSVLSLGQALDRLEEEKTFGTWDQLAEMTPWTSVNRRVGLWRPGNLVVLSGPQGTGKTTWALNVAAFWAGKGFPALAYCLEMSVEELVQHVLCAHYRLTEEQVTPAVIAQARQDLAEWPLYLGANPRITGRKEVLDLLGQAVPRYGLRLAAFDNLHMLARSIEHRHEEVGLLSKGFKLLAMELEIPLLLLAQPRKLQPGQVMTPWDLKDSVDIFSDADQILLLHRELVASRREAEAVAGAGEDAAADNLSPFTLLRVAKARHMATRDTTLYCEGAQHRFRSLSPEELGKTRGGGGRTP